MTERARVFRLFACCIPVRGPRRSTICDLQRQRYHLIPNGMYDLVEEHRDRSLEEILAAYPQEAHETLNEYIDFLIREEYGFWCDDPDSFPELDMTWERPETITNAVLDIDQSSRHDLSHLIAQLDQLGCASLQVRYFRGAALPELDEVMRTMHGSRLRSVELLVPWNREWDGEPMIELCGRFQRLTSVIVHSSPEVRTDHVPYLKTPIFYRTEVVDSHAHCGQVAPEWFVVTMKAFTEARAFNSCLNRKLAIDARGEIRNCPSLPASFGNAADTPLRDAVADPSFRDLWGITKDQVETCRDCEFRYICTDCRAFVRDPEDRLSKPAKCAYDPYTAQWG